MAADQSVRNGVGGDLAGSAFHALLDAVDEALLLIDGQGQVTLANSRFWLLFGLRPSSNLDEVRSGIIDCVADRAAYLMTVDSLGGDDDEQEFELVRPQRRVVRRRVTAVRDDEGRDLPDGEVGWLWVRGDSRAIAYWQNMEKTQAAFRGEWYVSGDMVLRDPRGNFVYCGRGDDMLKVGGKWLAPGEVENCLLTHPAVKEVAVVGVTDDSGLVKPHAYVTATSVSTTLGDELKAWVRDKLEPYKAPRDVVFVDSMPRTHLGKIDRGKLRKGG